MPSLLVVYGTTNGQAGKVAQFIGETLRASGLETDVVDASAVDPDPTRYGGVIVVASVHAGGYQRSVREWVRRSVSALRGVPTVFVSVCLGILQHNRQVDEDLAAIAQRFQAETGWTPASTKMVAGALPYSKYNWITRLLMRRIVQKAGGDTDTSRDYEYTDWSELRAFTEAFARKCRRPHDTTPTLTESL